MSNSINSISSLSLLYVLNDADGSGKNTRCHVSLSDQCRGCGIEPDGLPANTDVSQSSNCSPGTRNEPRTRPLSTERFRSLGFMPMEKSANITRGAAASRARDDVVWLLTARTAKSIRSVEPQRIP